MKSRARGCGSLPSLWPTCLWCGGSAKVARQFGDDDASAGAEEVSTDLGAESAISVQGDWDSLFFSPAFICNATCAADSGEISTFQSFSSSASSDGNGDVECRRTAFRRSRPDWWTDVDICGAKGFEGMAMASELLDVRVVRHEPSEKDTLVKDSATLYEEMGADSLDARYVAVWLNLSGCSLVLVSKASNEQLFDRCLAGDFLKQRLKLILNPVAVKLPFPAKGPRDADTVGSFFGSGAVSMRCRSRCGAEVHCVRVDLFSKWLMRLAMSKGGFQPGNIMELSLVDWENRAVLSGSRLIVDDDFAKLIA